MAHKTLGGNRLGSGGKMKVELHPYERSTHDLGYIWRSSMAPGTLVPFMKLLALPGDTFDIDLTANVMTHPTLGPLFGSFKVQLDVFEAPLRLYIPMLMQNTINVGLQMSSYILPKIVQNIGVTTLNSSSDWDNAQNNPSALLSYLGIRGWGLNLISGTPPRQFNAVPYLAYWEIYNNYYANQQETIGAYLLPPTPTATGISSVVLDTVTITPNSNIPPGTTLTAASSLVITFSGTAPDLKQIYFNTNRGQITAFNLGTWTATATTYTLNAGTYGYGTQIYGWAYINTKDAISVTTFPLSAINDLKTALWQTAPFNTTFTVTTATAAPYGPAMNLSNTKSSQCGLAIKTYQSDLFNNWLLTTSVNTVASSTAVSTVSGNQFKIDALILAERVYNILNRVIVSGNTYKDWISAIYDHEAYSICMGPIYHGGLSKELTFQEVVSTAYSNQQTLGTLAGRGAMTHKHKGGKIRIKINEPGYLIGIVSLTPRIDYSQGNHWDNYAISTMDDLHKPGLDQIGFQSLITEQLAWWDTHWNGSTFAQNTAGFQPAYVNYMTNYNQTYGNFGAANNEMFMTLNRRYNFNTANGNIQDLTTYIDPSHYNFIFAQTSADAQNFWTQIAVDITARRKMSAKVIPNL